MFVVDTKLRRRQRVPIEVARNMTPGQRLQKAFEMSDAERSRFITWLRKRYPHLADEDIRMLFFRRAMRDSKRKMAIAARM